MFSSSSMKDSITIRRMSEIYNRQEDRSMPNDLILTPEEKEVIDGVVTDGLSTINKDNVDELTFALFKAAPDTFNKAMNIISSDAKLKRDIVNEISKTTEQAVSSSVINSKKTIDNAIANSEVWRSLIKKDNISDERFRMCFEELRSETQKIEKTNYESQRFQSELISQQKEVIEKATRSTVGRDIAIGVGGITLGGFIFALIHKLFNRPDNNAK